MTRALYTYTIQRSGGHTGRWLVRIGRSDDAATGRGPRIVLSAHDTPEAAERAREAARHNPADAWRRAQKRAAEKAKGRIGTRRPMAPPPPYVPRETDSPRRIAFETLPLAEDTESLAFLAEHPDGATLEEIAAWLGVTRERIRQMESQALRSLAMRLSLAGVTESGDTSAITWVDEGRWPG